MSFRIEQIYPKSERLFVQVISATFLTSHATINSIGLEWEINGDDNHDAQCQIQYRVSGQDQWHDFMPLYRVDYNGANTLAGSILFLKPGTSYEINLMLSDPDGGSESRTETITTRSIPLLPVDGRVFHITPGSGGGDGSFGNPFQGIAAAQSVAGSGDIFLLHRENYEGEIEFNVSGISGSYIVWKGAGDGAIVI